MLLIYKKYFLLVMLSVLVVGCASLPRSTLIEDAQVKNFSDPEDNMAGVYIYRKSAILASGHAYYI